MTKLKAIIMWKKNVSQQKSGSGWILYVGYLYPVYLAKINICPSLLSTETEYMIFISYTSLVASAANSEVDIGFCWTLYSWYRPLLPFIICLIGAGIVDAILPYPDLRGTHSFGGITYTTIREVRHAYTLYQSLGNIYLVYTKQTMLLDLRDKWQSIVPNLSA